MTIKKLILSLFTLILMATPALAEDAYKRVIETKTLRCGYAPWPALIEVDPNSGDLSGTFYDYLNELGEAMGIEIVWEAEIGFGEIVEGFF